jgi:hypothetical protein
LCGAVDDIPCDEGSICDPGVDPASGTGHCILGPIVVDSSCLRPLQNFEYRGGSAFTIVSSQDEFGSRQKVDPQSGLCVPDETKGPLVIQRFHRLEAPCTDLSISATTPNPCSLTLTEPANLPTGGIVTRQSYGIRIRSVGVTFDVTDVALPFLPIPGVRFSPIFDDYTMNFSFTAGFAPLNNILSAPLPERVREAPDTTLWFVDSGDDSANFSTGQIIPMFQGVAPTQILPLR